MPNLELVKTSPTSPPLPSDETAHRIANHLALIVSTIRMRATSIANGPDLIDRDDVLAVLQVITGRLVGMSELNRSLLRAGNDSVDLHACLIDTCKALLSALSLNGRVAIVHKLGANCSLDADRAHALALVLNEIIVNAVKHAHPTGLPVTITVSCDRLSDGRLEIVIEDDGIGLPEVFDTGSGGGVGFKVIRALAEKLGVLEIRSDSLGLGFRFLIAPAAQQEHRGRLAS